MEDRYQHTVNGQAVLQADLNTMGEASSLADDRVFAELFRMQPYDGSTARKGILPYAHAASGLTALVAANGASGSVLVNPFRAFIGTRTAVATDAKKNWRDIRSAPCVGTTTLYQQVSFTANTSGNPRWDLLYAAVAVDANGASVTRKVKDPTTKAIAGSSLVTTLQTTVTLGVVVGTPGASPAYPATPTDASGVYYVPLAYLRIPNGFGASSTFHVKDINEVAPVISVSAAAGAVSLCPANQHNAVGGTAISGTGTSTVNGALAWSGTASSRAPLYLPPSMQGGASRIIAVDVGNASSAHWSHQDNDIVDSSVDWRKRFFRWWACIGSGASSFSGKFPWLVGGSVAHNLMNNYTAGGVSPPAGYSPGANSPAFAIGMGESFNTDQTIAQVAASGAAATATPATGYNAPTHTMASGTAVRLWVDSTTGAMKVDIAGAPLASVLFWIDATAPFKNH